MTEFVRFDASFEHKDAETGKRVRYPALWAGEVDAAVAKAARKAGAVPPAEKASKPSSEVTAARKAVADAEKAQKAAKTPDEKAKAENDLQAAQKALADLEA